MNSFQKRLHDKALEISKSFRKTESDLIEILVQVDEAKVFLALGYGSLFSYAAEALHLSEANAYSFTSVARKSKQIPELKEEIRTGNLSVSKAKRIVSVITPENKKEWIQKAVSLPKALLEKEVIKAHPETDKKESLRMISETRYSLKLGISEELLKKVKRAQILMMQKKRKTLSLEETLEIMAEGYLEKNDPVQRAKRINSKLEAQVETQKSEKLTLGSGTIQKQKAQRDPIPAAVKREIFLRDKGLCQFQVQSEASAKTCGSTAFVEIHHQRPISKGGQNTPNNLVTLCHQHHRYQHELGG